MRTTLDIDDDVLAAVEALASGQKTTAGWVVSILLRKALTALPPERPSWEGGVLVLPKRGGGVTAELVERLSEDEF